MAVSDLSTSPGPTPAAASVGGVGWLPAPCRGLTVGSQPQTSGRTPQTSQALRSRALPREGSPLQDLPGALWAEPAGFMKTTSDLGKGCGTDAWVTVTAPAGSAVASPATPLPGDGAQASALPLLSACPRGVCLVSGSCVLFVARFPCPAARFLPSAACGG